MYTFREFMKDALRTESTLDPLTNEIKEKTGLTARIVHGIMGIDTEVVEYLNAEDDINAAEEIGDILWYCAILVDELDMIDEVEEMLNGDLSYSNKCYQALDVIKKSMFYGKPLDIENIKEYVLDTIESSVLNISDLDTDLETVMKTVIEKLKVRYPEKFTKEKAINRDLTTERKVLEEGLSDIDELEGC